MPGSTVQSRPTLRFDREHNAEPIERGSFLEREAARIEAHTGQPLTDAWMAAFYARRNALLEAELQPIEGAIEAVRAVQARLGGRIACASGADRYKVEMQLQKVGLAPYFGANVFSGHEMPRTKPAPDVYLAAADHLGAAGAHCLVVEDTPTGVTAGVAAGATVWALCTVPAQASALEAAGATRLLGHMGELAALLATG